MNVGSRGKELFVTLVNLTLVVEKEVRNDDDDDDEV